MKPQKYIFHALKNINFTRDLLNIFEKFKKTKFAFSFSQNVVV